MIAALVLIGAPGTGKSAVLEALSALLERGGVAHGAIESEELTRGFPGLSNAVLLEQLVFALAAQRSAGRQLFLIAFTAESDADLRSVVQATEAERTLVVCLHTGADVLAERLHAREPERWPGKPGLIVHARRLAGVVPALDGIDIALETEDRDAEVLARAVVAEMSERGLL